MPEWLQEFKHGLVGQSVPENRDASSSSHELSLEPRAKVVPSKHDIFTHCPEDKNCDICLRTKITRASCRRRTGTVVPRADKFGDLTTADHKVFSDDVSLDTIIDTLSWYKTWLLNGYNSSHVKQKPLRKPRRAYRSMCSQFLWPGMLRVWAPSTMKISLMSFTISTVLTRLHKKKRLRKHKRACRSSWSRPGNQKSFTLPFFWNWEGLWRITPHRSETNGIAEKAVRRIRLGTSAVLLQSGLDERWWADSVECCCYLRNIQDLLSDGKTLYESFRKPFNGPVIPFGAMVEYHPISAKDLSRLHQFGPHVLPGIFLGYVLSAGVIWWSQTLNNWRRWTHQNSTVEGSM